MFCLSTKDPVSCYWGSTSMSLKLSDGTVSMSQAWSKMVSIQAKGVFCSKSSKDTLKSIELDTNASQDFITQFLCKACAYSYNISMTELYPNENTCVTCLKPCLLKWGLVNTSNLFVYVYSFMSGPCHF